MANSEKKRVKDQQDSLGEHGLKEKGERLSKANEENGVCVIFIVMSHGTH